MLLSRPTRLAETVWVALNSPVLASRLGPVWDPFGDTELSPVWGHRTLVGLGTQSRWGTQHFL